MNEKRAPGSSLLRHLSVVLCLLGGCIHQTVRSSADTAQSVNLSRFMGDWYVISSIPLWPERNAYNGVESYRLDEKGKIQTTYRFNNGRADGPLKSFHPVGTVYNTATNAEWRMQFLWPFKAAYLIHFVDENYQTTIVGEPKRRHVWIMARSPKISETDYLVLVARATALGYEVSKLRRVPHSPR